MTPEDFERNVIGEQVHATQFIKANYKDTSPDKAQKVVSIIGEEFT